ncbi:hypothetical protein RhiTH_011096 [Rhizoctonia solani]
MFVIPGVYGEYFASPAVDLFFKTLKLYWKWQLSMCGSLLLALSSYLPTISKPLDANEVKSHALKWLIKNCETPTSVAIALQAIAGATGAVPFAPLESCDASFKILQKLVSSGSEPSAAQDASLYARALNFLASCSQSGPEQETRARIDGVEPMVWELKVEHEWDLTRTIKDGVFLPTHNDLEALQIGNSAFSSAMRLLQGSDQDAKETMQSIKSLLEGNAEEGYQLLHPAAFHSLANGAAVLEACSSASLVSISEITSYVKAYQAYADLKGNARSVKSSSIRAALMLLIDAFLHRSNE